ELNEEVSRLEASKDSENSRLDTIKRVYDNLRDFIARTESEVQVLTSSISQVSEGVCPTCGRLYDDHQERSRLKKEYTFKLNEKNGLLNNLRAKLEGVKSQV